MKRNWLNVLFLVGVGLMVVVSCVIIIKTLEKKSITDHGIEVLAKVVEAPSSCDDLGRRPPYSKIEYNNQIFIKKTGNQFCHLVSKKDSVKMLTNRKGDELLFPNEYNPAQFVYASLLILIAVVITIRKFWF
ncbi:hypothetical protein [Flagellimonas allohymeniacidonis]|uniref:DUF3592 domain-containing protein n=1 Tax=Flagellimonas allohymeniacidonis TaxID=2517819 RepID=A0A4Q8QIG4_9FLAO|nr:hypothetical protein [Allomuricauda hymeniacidonis]TAI48493.1 hypothetical protein EW142_01425 [Allomuricauda hymeniacidonis]